MTEKPLLARKQKFFRPAVPLSIAAALILDLPLEKADIQVANTFGEQEINPINKVAS
ncbi:hypothetical protein HYT33_04570 [Candidatus Roizmanbacteria bacterium]|nr:hypothetical protein [Candidatus Roizmanbacteria bacterium]